MQTFIFTIFIFIILIWLYIIFFYKNKKLPKNKSDYYKKILRENEKKDISPKEKLITYDKIYHNILKDAWYNWSFWEILRKNPHCIKDIQKLWELHKLRNTLVHDLEEHNIKKLEIKETEYKNEIIKLLNNLK